MIEITKTLGIPEEELDFVTSRSSGPGGQNVNKVETRVTLRFDVINSKALSDEQKRRITNRLATRINKQGILQVSSQKARSQAGNRVLALDRFAELLQRALQRRPVRKKTRAPTSARERRLEAKKRRGRLKQGRSRPTGQEE